MQTTFLVFPTFNLYSMPLLFLVMQALIFAFLLLHRYSKSGALSDLLLALIIFITCFHRTTYTIGFMSWYDTFQNTKINYFLVDLTFLLSPLLYFYTKEVTTGRSTSESLKNWIAKHFIHFIPALLYVAFKIVVYCYDLSQPGFDETQNGVLVIALEWPYVNPFVSIFSNLQMMLYLAFSIQLYFNYRKRIEHFFSNTYQLELNWLRNFLLLYALILFYVIVQMVIDVAIIDLHWTQQWWFHFFSALVIVYVAIKGYFTNMANLKELDFGVNHFGINTATATTDHFALKNHRENSDNLDLLNQKKKQLVKILSEEKAFLNPDLNLSHLAQQLGWSRAELSEVINVTCGVNFNNFINRYRVAEVKEMLQAGKQKHLSLLGIAMDCGFSSKATFNRAFRKLEGLSPSQYLKGS